MMKAVAATRRAVKSLLLATQQSGCYMHLGFLNVFCLLEHFTRVMLC